MWALEESGAPYELTILTREEAAAAEHADRHPLNRVPVLDTGEGLLFESAALILHVADLHPDAGLIPPVGTQERGAAYQWVLFGMTEMEAPGIAVMTAKAAEDAQAADAAAERYRAALAVVGEALGDREYLLDSGFSVADIVIGSVINLGIRVGAYAPTPALDAYMARLEARPARVRAYAAIGQ